MIHDTLANAQRYHSLHPRFAHAFAWCQEANHLAKPDGRYPIHGDDLFVIVESGPTIAAPHKRFESHRRYIDIQVVLGGGEVMEWAPADNLAEHVAYNPEKDIRFHIEPARPNARIALVPGEFAIFYPEDAHKPCCFLGAGPSAFRKAVFKVDVAAR